MRTPRAIVFRRCGCTDQTGHQLARRCPLLLTESDHGSWYYSVQVPTVAGRRARRRRGGYPTEQAATTAGQMLLDLPQDQLAAQTWTVARWLCYWLQSVKPNLPCSTLNGYRDHVYRHLIPALGRLTLDELTSHRLQGFFDLLGRRPARSGRPLTPASVDRIRATLRSALNCAIREGILSPQTRSGR